MKIYYNLDKYFIIYNTKSNNYEEIFDSLESVCASLCKNDILMLPEEHFIFTNNHYTFYSPKPFTLTELKKLLEKNIYKDKKHNNLIGQIVQYKTNNVLANLEKEQFALGKTWQLSFDLNCIYTHAYSELPVEALTTKWITLLPLSFATLQYTNLQLPDTAYKILYIQKNNSKLISIVGWFYHITQYLNRGSWNLKTIYEEQQIPKIYWDPSKVNPVIESIVKETSWFFAEQITVWLESIIKPQVNTILISDLTKNHFVMDALKSLYSTKIWWYIIPFGQTHIEQGLPIDIDNYLKMRAWNMK